MIGILVLRALRVGVWLAVVSLMVLSVAQRRPRPNQGLREDETGLDLFEAGVEAASGCLPS